MISGLPSHPLGGDGRWKAEADAIGPAVLGRGPSADAALRDWRKRFRATLGRFLELRPFEMTPADRDLWARFQLLVDVPRYQAEAPLVVRQVGRIVKVRPGRTMVKWEDGSIEKVNPLVFDEGFDRFSLDQWFEASVSRDPFTFRIRRAEAVRKVAPPAVPMEQARDLWERVAGPAIRAQKARLPAPELDEAFWLSPPE